MQYQYEATTLKGFVQQLTTNYVGKGYVYYVTGVVRDKKTKAGRTKTRDPRLVDERILRKYSINKSRWQRSRQKSAGMANLHYLRWRHFFVILATEPKGGHWFFEHHADQVEDIRKKALKVGGYSISHRRGKARVRMDLDKYREMKAHALSLAKRRDPAELETFFRRFPFEPWGPVIYQVFAIFRAVNRARKTAGYEPVPERCLRLRRRSVRVWEPPSKPDSGVEAA